MGGFNQLRAKISMKILIVLVTYLNILVIVYILVLGLSFLSR